MLFLFGTVRAQQKEAITENKEEVNWGISIDIVETIPTNIVIAILDRPSIILLWYMPYRLLV